MYKHELVAETSMSAFDAKVAGLLNEDYYPMSDLIVKLTSTDSPLYIQSFIKVPSGKRNPIK